jgi:tetratricopeptide (TPR) repeat protein
MLDWSFGGDILVCRKDKRHSRNRCFQAGIGQLLLNPINCGYWALLPLASQEVGIMVTGEVNVKALQVRVPHKGLKSNNLCASGDARLSTKELEKALKPGPLLTSPRHNLAATYQRQKELDKAIAEWQGILHIYPRDADALLGLGEAYEKLGECIKAVQCYQGYIDLVMRGDGYNKIVTKIAEDRMHHLCRVIKAVYSCTAGGYC